jgi:hypothetical protein
MKERRRNCRRKRTEEEHLIYVRNRPTKNEDEKRNDKENQERIYGETEKGLK